MDKVGSDNSGVEILASLSMGLRDEDRGLLDDLNNKRRKQGCTERVQRGECKGEKKERCEEKAWRGRGVCGSRPFCMRKGRVGQGTEKTRYTEPTCVRVEYLEHDHVFVKVNPMENPTPSLNYLL